MTPPDETTFSTEEVIYNESIEPLNLTQKSRFAWLCILTYNLYLIWWTYKAYRFFAQKENSSSNSAIKALFNFIFLPSLLYKTRNFAREKSYAYNYYPIFLYLPFLSCCILGTFPIPFAFLLINISCLFLLPLVGAFNFSVTSSREIHSSFESRLSIWKISLIIIGSLFWLIMIAGSILQLMISQNYLILSKI